MNFFVFFLLKNLHMCWIFRTFAPYLGIMRTFHSFRGGRCASHIPSVRSLCPHFILSSFVKPEKRMQRRQSGDPTLTEIPGLA